MGLEFLIVHTLGSFKSKEHWITTELAQTQMHKTSTKNIPLIASEMGQDNLNTIFLFFKIPSSRGRRIRTLESSWIMSVK